MVEKSKHEELEHILPKLCADLLNNCMSTQSDYRVPWRHVNMEAIWIYMYLPTTCIELDPRIGPVYSQTNVHFTLWWCSTPVCMWILEWRLNSKSERNIQTTSSPKEPSATQEPQLWKLPSQVWDYWDLSLLWCMWSLQTAVFPVQRTIHFCMYLGI